MEYSRYGSKFTRDFIFRWDGQGVYVCLGRLDMRYSRAGSWRRWCWERRKTQLANRAGLALGKVDFMLLSRPHPRG